MRTLLTLLLIVSAASVMGNMACEVTHPRQYLFGIRWRMFLLPVKRETFTLKAGDTRKVGNLTFVYEDSTVAIISNDNVYVKSQQGYLGSIGGYKIKIHPTENSVDKG